MPCRWDHCKSGSPPHHLGHVPSGCIHRKPCIPLSMNAKHSLIGWGGGGQWPQSPPNPIREHLELTEKNPKYSVNGSYAEQATPLYSLCSKLARDPEDSGEPCSSSDYYSDTPLKGASPYSYGICILTLVQAEPIQLWQLYQTKLEDNFRSLKKKKKVKKLLHCPVLHSKALTIIK